MATQINIVTGRDPVNVKYGDGSTGVIEPKTERVLTLSGIVEISEGEETEKSAADLRQELEECAQERLELQNRLGEAPEQVRRAEPGKQAPTQQPQRAA